MRPTIESLGYWRTNPTMASCFGSLAGGNSSVFSARVVDGCRDTNRMLEERYDRLLAEARDSLSRR